MLFKRLGRGSGQIEIIEVSPRRPIAGLGPLKYGVSVKSPGATPAVQEHLSALGDTHRATPLHLQQGVMMLCE